jgi:nucleotide-binding universal stress UspA family protein
MYASALIALDREDEAGSRLMASRLRAFLSHRPLALHLVHVRTPLPRSYLADLPAHWETRDRAETENWLRTFAAENGFTEALESVNAPAGSIAREVVSLAAKLGVEAIMAAAHRFDFARRLLGTNTHAISRDAPCDVIVVRGNEG